MTQHSDWTIGIDLGDRKSVFFAYCKSTGEFVEGSFSMSEPGLRKGLARWSSGEVVIEAGGQSRWVMRVLESMGFDVLVADPRHLGLITKSQRKNDRNDAESLARLAAADLELVNPVHLRNDRMQADLAVAKARDALVRTRTQLVNVIRGMAKSTGHRLPTKSAASFHLLRDDVPAELELALSPLFEQIASLTDHIRYYDRVIEGLCEERYPETRALTAVRGVGSLTALVYVLTLGDLDRFERSRDAAAFIGLCPRQHESGNSKKELGITKAGDRLLRKLLVHSAHYILGPFGEDCDLRRWGDSLVRRGGKAAKKRAAVAVARKLAVLLHRLLADQSEYERLRQHDQHVA